MLIISPIDVSLMVRYVDDTLFVTTSRELAMDYVAVVHNGFKDYGADTNVAKTRVNFDVSFNGVRNATIREETILLRFFLIRFR